MAELDFDRIFAAATARVNGVGVVRERDDPLGLVRGVEGILDRLQKANKISCYEMVGSDLTTTFVLKGLAQHVPGTEGGSKTPEVRFIIRPERPEPESPESDATQASLEVKPAHILDVQGYEKGVAPLLRDLSDNRGYGAASSRKKLLKATEEVDAVLEDVATIAMAFGLHVQGVDQDQALEGAPGQNGQQP